MKKLNFKRRELIDKVSDFHEQVYPVIGKGLRKSEVIKWIRKIYPISYRELNNLFRAEREASYYFNNTDKKLFRRATSIMGRDCLISITLECDCDRPRWSVDFVKDTDGLWYHASGVGRMREW